MVKGRDFTLARKSRWAQKVTRPPTRQAADLVTPCCCCVCFAFWRLFQPACVVVQQGKIVGLCGTHKHQFAHHGAHMTCHNARVRVCTTQHGMYLECARRDNVAGRRGSAVAASGLSDVSSIARQRDACARTCTMPVEALGLAPSCVRHVCQTAVCQQQCRAACGVQDAWRRLVQDRTLFRSGQSQIGPATDTHGSSKMGISTYI
jgi:hypothetical protein